MSANPLKWLGQGLFYAAIVALLGFFASAPAYHHLGADKAMIKVTFTHGGKYKGGCRRRTAEELRKLAPNMRRPFDCPRDRLPVTFQLDLDGSTIYSASLPPSGLHGDGPSILYRGFEVPAGEHSIALRLRDSDRAEGFDYEAQKRFDLKPGKLLVVQFRAEEGGFIFRE